MARANSTNSAMLFPDGNGWSFIFWCINLPSNSCDVSLPTVFLISVKYSDLSYFMLSGFKKRPPLQRAAVMFMPIAILYYCKAALNSSNVQYLPNSMSFMAFCTPSLQSFAASLRLL